MSSINYLHLLSQYETHRVAVQSLVGSIISSFATVNLLDDYTAQRAELAHLAKAYPFVELMYSLDAHGVQILDTAYSPHVSERNRRRLGQGSDRSHRPYFVAARDHADAITVTDPYLSSATQLPAISAVHRFLGSDGTVLGYLVLNINLQKMVAYLNGDHMRHRFHPVFQAVYSIIGGLLLVVAVVLLGSATVQLAQLMGGDFNVVTQSFGVVVLITLGLAIFDLGKTILEEEVFVHKDIHHHGSTRRTITRFMSAILIAVSIESLLLMFKSLLGESTQLLYAVWMLLASVALLIGLGIYLKLSKDG